MKTILPWLCVAALGIGLAVMYMTNQKQTTELTQLRADSQEFQSLRAAAEDAKKNQSESESAELARLREDNKDLLRLRAEAGKLRTEKEQLTKQMQSAQTQAQTAQAQAQAAQVQVQTAQQQAHAARAEQAQAALMRLNVAPEARAGVCINNLRQIEAAKQQWAAENPAAIAVIPTAADLAKYLPNKTLPVCPGGGAYAINAASVKPTCSVAGHVLPE
jgi:chromosome segregation ATPase